MRTLSIIIDIVLAIGLFGIFNESASFIPNFVGVACFIALIYKHRNDVKTENEQ